VPEMRYSLKNRRFSLLSAIGYALIVVGAPLFHNHSISDGDGCSLAVQHRSDERSPDVDSSAAEEIAVVAHSSEGESCPVCQFLANKPAPAAEITPVASGELVESVALAALPSPAAAFFSAWQSRAPPCFA
jgi:hypothetical protein